jgi:hypothetical protein
MKELLPWLSVIVTVLMPFFWYIINSHGARLNKIEINQNEIENKGLLNEERLNALKDKIEQNSKLDDQLRKEVITRNGSLDTLEKVTEKQNALLILIAEKLGLGELTKNVIK